MANLLIGVSIKARDIIETVRDNHPNFTGKHKAMKATELIRELLASRPYEKLLSDVNSERIKSLCNIGSSKYQAASKETKYQIYVDIDEDILDELSAKKLMKKRVVMLMFDEAIEEITTDIKTKTSGDQHFIYKCVRDYGNEAANKNNKTFLSAMAIGYQSAAAAHEEANKKILERMDFSNMDTDYVLVAMPQDISKDMLKSLAQQYGVNKSYIVMLILKHFERVMER